MAAKPKRKRDFAGEYKARIARGLASGKSRSQARGHAKASDLPQPETPAAVDRKDPLERALKLMKQGSSQKEAAKSVGVSTERLRRYLRQNTSSERKGGRWVIRDMRPVTVLMATRCKVRDVTVTRDAASDIGRHWVAVNKFLESNDPTTRA